MRIPTIYDQTATITASVEQGTARIYIPYYNGYEYIDITPTTSGEISGWLEQSPYAAGELGVYGIWVEAVEGEIKGFSMRAES